MNEKEPTQKVTKKKTEQIPQPVPGAIYSPTDVRDYRLTAAAAPTEFPEEFVLPIGRVKNQNLVSSCVAHSLSGVAEYFNKKQHDNAYAMSTDFIYGNRRTSDYRGEGMIVRDALKALQKYGDIRSTKMPGNTEVPDVIDKFEAGYEELKEEAYKSRISTYVRLKTVNEVKTFLMNHGPVVIAMDWYSDFIVLDSGNLVSKFNPADIVGGHCMLLMGWNSKGWVIKNSWSYAWGCRGTCYFNIDWTDRIHEMWGVTDEIFDNPDAPEEEDDVKPDPDIEKPWHTKIGQFFAKILNWILNLFKRKE